MQGMETGDGRNPGCRVGRNGVPGVGFPWLRGDLCGVGGSPVLAKQVPQH